ncbi:hypothetical protein BCR37DRAFT_377692 [Protomyces lactucae-debilis]|uniref:Uncharacterized protein n=1 Tax=Protomyces lactucae-debilis TaxID=2754530 RepID=A0A1Y2FMP3_PROLT|nr:uncharacterized protein BCR37DRAFT_377692 [Protomyces lactucae-debilis]ORY84857.1 hypothetical protein BCR37DRAFT_377692 [Protomyces lactucae-debilis]
MYLIERSVTQRQPISCGHVAIRCHYICIARLLTQEGWELENAAWDPLVDCDRDSPGTAERERLCHHKKPGPKSKSSQSKQCTATLQRELILQVPLTQSIFTIDLNKEPAEDPVAPLTAAGSSQQPNLNLECTQTFLSFGLEQNEVCLDPKDPQPGYCPPGP